MAGPTSRGASLEMAGFRRDYAAEADVMAPRIVDAWVPGGTTIVFYGVGDAVLERLILERLAGLPITRAVVVDQLPIPALAPVRDIELVPFTDVPEATLYIERSDGVVGAVVACGFQNSSGHGVAVEPLWRSRLYGAAKAASVVGLFEASADVPCIRYSNVAIEEGGSADAFRAAVEVLPCHDVARDQAAWIMNIIHDVARVYGHWYGDAEMLPNLINRDAEPTMLVALVCSKIGADLVDEVAGDDLVGTRIKRIAHTLSFPRLDTVHTRVAMRTTASRAAWPVPDPGV